MFDEWRKNNRISVPKVGEAELKGKTVGGLSGGDKKYRHKAGVPKADKDAGKRKGRTVGAPGRLGAAPGGLRTADEIRKARVDKEKRGECFPSPSFAVAALTWAFFISSPNIILNITTSFSPVRRSNQPSKKNPNGKGGKPQGGGGGKGGRK